MVRKQFRKASAQAECVTASRKEECAILGVNGIQRSGLPYLGRVDILERIRGVFSSRQIYFLPKCAEFLQIS